MEKIPSWIERLLLPKLNEITGEIKALEAKIESVDNKVDVRIDNLRTEMLVKFEAADVKAASLRNEVISRFGAMDAKFEAMDYRFDSLDARIPVMEKIAAFEVRLADCGAF